MIATRLSTVFGVGYVPFAPGTMASALALPFGWLISWKLGVTALCVASLATYVIGVWSCGIHAARTGGVDPSGPSHANSTPERAISG